MNSSQPKAPDRATQAVERLLLVTLALEDSLRDEQFAESNALFVEREAILEELRDLVLTPKTQVSVSRVQAVEKRILGFLSDWRTAAIRELDGPNQGRRASNAYLAAAGVGSFSMDRKH